MRDSTLPQRLFDPDYYRLRYQLAAQLMHREETRREGKRRRRVRFATPSDILHGERLPADERRAPAEAEALALIDDARRALSFFEERVRTKKWGLLPVELTVRQQRLREFLLRTVVPCLEILVAASRRHTGRRSAGEAQLTTLRHAIKDQRRAPKSERSVSYRVIYNLACYEAGGEAPDKATVMEYLRQALDEAPADRRRELGRWAGKDPSFKALHGDPAFGELLSPFK